MEQIAEKIIETDVLVVGAGLGGCCAAAKAREHGLDVTLLEKSATVRSGALDKASTTSAQCSHVMV